MMLEVGIIGYGGRMTTVTETLMNCGGVRVAAIADPQTEKARKTAEEHGYEDVHFYETAEEMLEKEPHLNGVMIGTRCSLHTRYALLVAKYGLPLFLEKPVSITEEQLEALRAIPHMEKKTVVSFPLRLSRLITHVKELVDGGKIGKIAHIEAYNNVPYGRGYYHKWYRDENETGGLFLQKATHDLDYINFLLGGEKPLRICAVTSKQIFKGDMPAGLKCEDCARKEECPESPQNVKKLGDRYAIGPYCCFAVDTGNEDSGSAIIQYESGMHAVYTQDFIVRGGAGKRGARLIGYYGTLEFDFVTNKIKLWRHLENVAEEYTLGGIKGSHAGGDEILVQNFKDVMAGKDSSHSPLSEGIASAHLCLMAKKSAKEHIFIDL